MKTTIRIGCGAGFSGDRLEPAVVLAEKANLDYLVLECLAERTIALAQKRKRADPLTGYDPFLERRLEALLPIIVKNNIKLITNMGAANPLAAAEKVIELARRLNIRISVAAITGDDVLTRLDETSPVLETGLPLSSLPEIISANAYLGTEGILEALKAKVNIIITGRVADPSLFLAPMMFEFNWRADDFDLLGKGTVIGHLLECAGQVTGGYFADPGKKDVPNLANLGHPYADVSNDGTATLGKVDGTGGVISLATAKEQLLYEVVNPSAYITPDVVADFTTVRLAPAGHNKILVSGGSGSEKPPTLKVSVGYPAFFLGEGEISYGGSNAIARARLAGEIIRERLGSRLPGLRTDLIGQTALHGEQLPTSVPPYEVRLRVSAKTESASEAMLVGEEVEALYTNGPAGGGGARKFVNEVIGIVSVLMPRAEVVHHITIKST